MKRQNPSLDISRSYKGCYPFKLATTSFIYQDSWVPNTLRLADHLDEVELLILECDPDNYPSAYDIRELERLAKERALTYNVHLPMDIYLGHKEAVDRQAAVDTVRQVVQMTGDIPVSAYVVHAVWEEEEADASTIDHWRARVRQSLEAIIADGLEASRIAVETLDYPIAWLDPVISDLGLSVCLDLGHLWVAGLDPLAHYQTYREQTRIIHLHGVKNGHDHLSLDYLDPDQREAVRLILSDFTGVVSLELFSIKDLIPSLAVLETICRDCVCS